jgi:hypothetical protein
MIKAIREHTADMHQQLARIELALDRQAGDGEEASRLQ